jgi:muramidase (phage lysozyme)
VVYSKEEVIQLIKDYSAQYGIAAELPLRVANCESGYNQDSRNRNSTASGVFQYIASTWRNTEAGRLGISPFDADANVHMAIKSIASGGIGNWSASRLCWKS